MVFLLQVIVIIIIIKLFLTRIFSEYTKANTTSVIPLDTILSEICSFIIGFCCTVCTKMMSLAGSLSDVVLADSILIPIRPPIPSTNIKMVMSSKKVRKVVTEKPLLVNEKRRCRDG